MSQAEITRGKQAEIRQEVDAVFENAGLEQLAEAYTWTLLMIKDRFAELKNILDIEEAENRQGQEDSLHSSLRAFRGDMSSLTSGYFSNEQTKAAFLQQFQALVQLAQPEHR
ncbi:hypothetical protein LRY65_00485 [Candidatus Woesebacteria bacterium]|nr:hypothetical protein [Candidatus Woesebacteria bacterium]MCD8507047.1 hypothetical protein [Candidatus Woesebacteria bacterium]MCD8526677.1 hypothetical protein [Candidatus Woesebacteria bacterium]MCD8546702.1 hypothetical protein [Candidatus Woesebacteria bacterium]